MITDPTKYEKRELGAEHGQGFESFEGELRSHYSSGDVISIPYCDFSSDPTEDIGKKFTLSSRGKIYVMENVPFIFYQVRRSYAIGWIGRSTSDRGLKGSPWVPEF